jgi:hypothetical protein
MLFSSSSSFSEEAKVLISYVDIQVTSESALLILGFLTTRESIFVNLPLAGFD